MGYDNLVANKKCHCKITTKRNLWIWDALIIRYGTVTKSIQYSLHTPLRSGIFSNEQPKPREVDPLGLAPHSRLLMGGGGAFIPHFTKIYLQFLSPFRRKIIFIN